jgi:hypothetical protein
LLRLFNRSYLGRSAEAAVIPFLVSNAVRFETDMTAKAIEDARLQQEEETLYADARRQGLFFELHSGKDKAAADRMEQRRPGYRALAKVNMLERFEAWHYHTPLSTATAHGASPAATKRTSAFSRGDSETTTGVGDIEESTSVAFNPLTLQQAPSPPPGTLRTEPAEDAALPAGSADRTWADILARCKEGRAGTSLPEGLAAALRADEAPPPSVLRLLTHLLGDTESALPADDKPSKLARRVTVIDPLNSVGTPLRNSSGHSFAESPLSPSNGQMETSARWRRPPDRAASTRRIPPSPHPSHHLFRSQSYVDISDMR